MNQGQEKFLGFFLEKAISEKHGEAKSMIGDMFEKMEKGELNVEHLSEAAPKMLEMIKDEHMDEVKGVIEGFIGNFGKGGK